MGEAFVLEKGILGAIGGAEVAVVGVAVHEVKIGEDGSKLGLGEEDVFGAVMGCFVEHVDDV